MHAQDFILILLTTPMRRSLVRKPRTRGSDSALPTRASFLHSLLIGPDTLKRKSSSFQIEEKSTPLLNEQNTSIFGQQIQDYRKKE